MSDHKKTNKNLKAKKALEVPKKQEIASGNKPKYINMGVRGSDITGIKRW